MGGREVKRSNSKLNDSEKKSIAFEKKIKAVLGEPAFNTFFLSPVKEGYIKYTDLINGGLTLFDIEQMNESISYYIGVNNIIHEKEDGS